MYRLLQRPCCSCLVTLTQARERQQEAEERLSLLEEQLAVKEKTFALMEADLDKVCEHGIQHGVPLFP